jgi:hypothetical protein
VAGAGGAAGAVSIGVVAAIALACGLVWLALRLSMIGPMLVEEGQIRFGEAWAITKGHVGSLLAIALLLILIFIGAELVWGVVAIGALFASVGPIGPNSPLLHATPAEILARLVPMFVVMVLGAIALFACVTPVFNAPWARAYRDLRRTDLASTFN